VDLIGVEKTTKKFSIQIQLIRNQDQYIEELDMITPTAAYIITQILEADSFKTIIKDFKSWLTEVVQKHENTLNFSTRRRS